MKLILVPSHVHWQDFIAWWPKDGVRPMYSEHGLFVADADRRVLLAGVCIYPTKGIFALVEHFEVNQQEPITTRHAAADAICDAMRTYAATTGKFLLIMSSSQGVDQMLMRHGWQENYCRAFALQPYAPLPEKATPPGNAAGGSVSPEGAAPQTVQERPKRVKRGKKTEA